MKFIILISVLFISSFLQAQINEDSAWIMNNFSKKEVMIPMRDGVKLYTAIYTPKDNSEKHPMLMNRTPYSCAPYGMKITSRSYTSNWKHYMKLNYILVAQDVRGKYMSEGKFEDVRPFNPNKKGIEIDEASDTYDAIDWLVKNVENNNGNVGVFGISYPGFYSTMAGLSRHPNLKCVSPQAPVTDWFMGDDFHHNGAFAMMDAFDFYYSFGKPRPFPSAKFEKGFEYNSNDNYDYFLKMGALKNYNKFMGDSIEFWKDLYNHPNYDNWWQARDARKYVEQINCPTLVVGGYFDAEDTYGAWNLYKAIEKKNKNIENKIVMGPWFHGSWGGRGDGSYLGNIRFGSKTSEDYAIKYEIPFMEKYLRDNTSDNFDKIKEANIFISGKNEWQSFNEWPPKMIREEYIYLNNNFKLASISGLLPTNKTNKEMMASGFDSYTSDPNKPVPYTQEIHLDRTREYMTDDQRFAFRRPDVLSYNSGILENDITVTGKVIADLYTSISTTDADFVVKIIDVYPDDFKYEKDFLSANKKFNVEMAGYQMLVRGEIFRGRFRNSFEKPKAFTPNKITNVKFDMPDIAHTFKKGHQIMIQIQSTWFPLFDRNPQQFVNPYTCNDSDFKKAEIKIYHQANAYSRIILPVLSK